MNALKEFEDQHSIYNDWPFWRERMNEYARLVAEGQTTASNGTPLVVPQSVQQPEKALKTSFTLGEMFDLNDDDCEIDYLVQGILVPDEPGFIIGHRKSCKTLNGMALGIAIATGTEFLNRFATNEQRRVLFVSGESARKSLIQASKAIAGATGVTKSHQYGGDAFRLETALPDLSNPDAVQRLAQVVSNEGRRLVFIDPVYLALGHDGNEPNLFAMGGKYGEIVKSLSAVGCQTIFIHHASGSSTNQYGSQRRVSLDSGAFAGCSQFMRQWMLISRRSEFKDWDPSNDLHELNITVGGSSGFHNGFDVDIRDGWMNMRRWLVSEPPSRNDKATDATKEDTATAGPKATNDELTAVVTAVEALQGAGTVPTRSQIQKKLGWNKKSGGKLDRVLEYAVETRLLVKNITRQYPSYEVASPKCPVLAAGT